MRRRWGRVALIVVAAVFVLALIVMIAGKYVIIPSMIRHAASSAVRERWDGDLSIGTVDFNWTGPISLGRIALRDAQGRPWAQIGSVELTLRDWPSLHPVLTDVAVDGVQLQALFAEGKLQLPLKPPPPSGGTSGNSSYVDLRRFAIRNMSFAVTPSAGSRIVWDGFELELRRNEKGYGLTIDRKAQDPSEKFSVTGNYTGQSALDYVTLSMRHNVTPAEASGILAALAVPGVSQASGKIAAEVQIRGRLEAPASCQPAGKIVLADWRLAGTRGPLATGISADIKMDSASGAPAAQGDILADMCGGRTETKLRANITPARSLAYHAETRGTGLSLDALVKSFVEQAETRGGTLGFKYVVDGDTSTSGLPTGRGSMSLEDANLLGVPVLTRLLDLVGLSDADPLRDTDVGAVFSMTGQTMTFDKASLANAAVAVDVQPGGTVDFATHQLDLYVLAVPVRKPHDLVASIPLVKSVVGLGDKLARVHIRGNWSDPPASLVTKEPLTDLTEGAKEFFESVASEGGDMAGFMLRQFNELLPGQ